MLVKYSSPIENWLEFYNDLWGKGLKHFQDQYIVHQLDKNGVSFRTMKNHRALNLSVKGLLVRDEWNVTWDWAENACNKGVRNFIIVGPPGIGVHHFLHISFCPPLTLRIREDPFSLLHSCNAFGPRSHNVLSTRF